MHKSYNILDLNAHIELCPIVWMMQAVWHQRKSNSCLALLIISLLLYKRGEKMKKCRDLEGKKVWSKKWSKKKKRWKMSDGKRREKMWKDSDIGDVGRERGRDDRVLTSEDQQYLHITQLSWKINSLWNGQQCQDQPLEPHFLPLPERQSGNNTASSGSLLWLYAHSELYFFEILGCVPVGTLIT